MANASRKHLVLRSLPGRWGGRGIILKVMSCDHADGDGNGVGDGCGDDDGGGEGDRRFIRLNIDATYAFTSSLHTIPHRP